MTVISRSWLVAGLVFASGCIIRPNPNPNDATDTNNQNRSQNQGQGESHISTTGNAQITIVNRSSTNICYVNISSSSDSNWGGDRLASDEVIAAGASRGWGVDPGAWDVRLQDCQHNTLAERRGISVTGPTQVSYP